MPCGCITEMWTFTFVWYSAICTEKMILRGIPKGALDIWYHSYPDVLNTIYLLLFWIAHIFTSSSKTTSQFNISPYEKRVIQINISHPAHKTGSNIKSELRQTNPLWQSDTEEENKYKHSKFAFPGLWLNPYAALTFFMLGCRACNLLVMFHSRPALFVVCHISEKHIQVIILFQTLNPTQLCRRDSSLCCQSNIISNCESHHIQYCISLWFEIDSRSTSGAACKLKQLLRGIWKQT